MYAFRDLTKALYSACLSMMKRSPPLQVAVYEDLLCAWCHVGQTRLETLQHEFGDALVWEHRPFAVRVSQDIPTPEERHTFLRQIARAKNEPEGVNLSTELWTSADSPRSSLPALVAVEAARLQAPGAARQLARRVRQTALESGLNVTRSDILFELAERVGLDMGRFAAAFQSPALRRWVLEEHRQAMARGIRVVPTLVIGERWMVCGVRELDEYRRYLSACLHKRRLHSGADNDPLH